MTWQAVGVERITPEAPADLSAFSSTLAPSFSWKRSRVAQQLAFCTLALPTAAVRPVKSEHDGKKVNSVAIKQDRCMYCGNCYTMCPALPISDGEGDEHIWNIY